MEETVIVREGYYLVLSSEEDEKTYHKVLYAETKERFQKLLETDCDGYTLHELKNIPQMYLLSGCRIQLNGHKMNVFMAHGENLCKLYQFMDGMDIETQEGLPVYFSPQLRFARSTWEIRSIIDFFNGVMANEMG